MSGLRIGTSAFTAAGWESAFYPAAMKPADYLTYYATKFDTVEVDSTFYRTPSVATVNGWDRKTPDGFLFSLKVPQTITHEQVLVDCDADLKHFINTMELLGPKLGPMVFQFPYFNKKAFKSGGEFLARLGPFLKGLPKSHRFAVEIRNKNWLDARFAETLREHGVALVLQDQSWMPRPGELFERFDPITADFTYARLLGDRSRIEKLTKTWDKVIVDRSSELSEWHDILSKVKKRGVQEFVYVNNHFSGSGFATARSLLKMFGDTSSQRGTAEQKSLFK